MAGETAEEIVGEPGEAKAAGDDRQAGQSCGRPGAQTGGAQPASSSPFQLRTFGGSP